MPQGPVRATQEFSILRRANSLEVIPSQTPSVTKVLHGGLHNIRDMLYRNSDQSQINPALPVFGLGRTRSFDCLLELENLTLSRSPLTPHEGHKAPLPSNEMPAFVCRRRGDLQTPEENTSPPTYSPYYVDARSPPIESPDQYKIGSSPRINCSFLFAQQPPASAAQATCIKGSSMEHHNTTTPSVAPDKSKIKIIFSSNSVFNRPAPPSQDMFPTRPAPPSITRHSPAEQACK